MEGCPKNDANKNGKGSVNSCGCASALSTDNKSLSRKQDFMFRSFQTNASSRCPGQQHHTKLSQLTGQDLFHLFSLINYEAFGGIIDR